MEKPRISPKKQLAGHEKSRRPFNYNQGLIRREKVI